MLKDIPIFHKTYELVLWLYPTINKFPKSQRFVLGQRMENGVVHLLELIIQANYSRDKLPFLIEASRETNLLVVFMRLAKDLRFLSIRQYEFATSCISEISKMLGGWIKSVR